MGNLVAGLRCCKPGVLICLEFVLAVRSEAKGVKQNDRHLEYVVVRAAVSRRWLLNQEHLLGGQFADLLRQFSVLEVYPTCHRIIDEFPAESKQSLTWIFNPPPEVKHIGILL